MPPLYITKLFKSLKINFLGPQKNFHIILYKGEIAPPPPRNFLATNIPEYLAVEMFNLLTRLISSDN